MVVEGSIMNIRSDTKVNINVSEKRIENELQNFKS